MKLHIALQLVTVVLEELLYPKYRQKELFQNTGNQLPGCTALPPKAVVIENLKSRKINTNEAAVLLNCDAKQGKTLLLTGISINLQIKSVAILVKPLCKILQGTFNWFVICHDGTRCESMRFNVPLFIFLLYTKIN